MSAYRRLAAASSVLAFVTGISPSKATETQTYTYDVHGHLVVVEYVGGPNNGKAHAICYDPADNRVRYKSDTAASVPACISAPTPAPTGPPSFATGDAYAIEGSTLNFVVIKTGATSSSFSVNYATSNGTALAGSDYVAASGTLTFGPSESQKVVSVSTYTGGGLEPGETMTFAISGPTGGSTITAPQGIGTIEDGGGGNGCPTC